MSREFAGARWWKFDFHAHTPFSKDTPWAKLVRTPEELKPGAWLLKFMAAGIDCVAITDHNGGGWIDVLKTAYDQMKSERPEGFRELYLFPGVELTVNSGVHLLAIFDRDATTSDIDTLLGRVEYDGTKGGTDGCTQKSIIEVIQAVATPGATSAGIPIPAHVDRDRTGLLRTGSSASGRAEIGGSTLQQVLDSRHVFAMEVLDRNALLPRICEEAKCNWTSVLGSDCQSFRKEPLPGSRFTWVKMGQPSLEGLRLALLDGASMSIRRSDSETGDPNERHGELLIESIEIARAKFAGRETPLKVEFSPWLSTLIGGRGSGKSTVIQFLRWVFGDPSPGELPTSVQEDFARFAKVHDGEEGALLHDTAARVVLRRGASRLQVSRSVAGGGPVVEEELDGAWKPAERGILSTLHVRILAQREILGLAADPTKVLALVDRVPGIREAEWRAQWETEKATYLRLRSTAREVRAKLLDRERIRGELHEVRRQLTVFEAGGHRELLQAYQRFQRQRHVVAQRAAELETAEGRVRAAAQAIEPSDAFADEFTAGVPSDAEAVTLVVAAREFQADLVHHLTELASDARAFRDSWDEQVRASKWHAAATEAEGAYRTLIDRLAAAGVEDPGVYGALVQKRQSLEKRHAELDLLEASLAPLDADAETARSRLGELRRELTKRRRDYLAKALDGNTYVRIELLRYGDDPKLEEEHFRGYVGREGTTFGRDILDERGGLLADLYRNLPSGPTRDAELEARLDAVRDRLLRAAAGDDTVDFTKPFCGHLRGLAEEQQDLLRIWWPRDDVRIEYRRRPDTDKWVPAKSGSKGQQAVAMLAFLLASGDEPIVFDQPEDDLDNQVIFELVVARIQAQKPRRQIIVATHNPNIVVNGDAERVLAMDFKGAQCVLVDGESGCLQETGVREAVCRVMEGGRKAFLQRYARIGRIGDGDA